MAGGGKGDPATSVYRGIGPFLVGPIVTEWAVSLRQLPYYHGVGSMGWTAGLGGEVAHSIDTYKYQNVL
jgi:hypothetical protein